MQFKWNFSKQAHLYNTLCASSQKEVHMNIQWADKYDTLRYTVLLVVFCLCNVIPIANTNTVSTTDMTDQNVHFYFSILLLTNGTKTKH